MKPCGPNPSGSGSRFPPDHEHAFNAEILGREEAEYALADRLLCPSDFVLQSFLDEGYESERLVRHLYGFDGAQFHPPAESRPADQGINMLFAGVAAVRKGVHFALEAWLRSPASETGKFRIAGEFLPDYAERLSDMLAHPSVEVLGHRSDIADLMRASDVFILPSIEEGSALVCNEALASGCALLVSDMSTAVCRHGENGLMHHVADVDTLTAHLTSLHEDRELLARLRAGAVRTAPEFTWTQAGVRLVEVYEETAQMFAEAAPARVAA